MSVSFSIRILGSWYWVQFTSCFPTSTPPTYIRYWLHCIWLPAVTNLMHWLIQFQFFQLINQRLRYITEFTNFVEIALYVLALLATLDYEGYYIDPLTVPVDDRQFISNSSAVMLDFQFDTHIRQVSRKCTLTFICTTLHMSYYRNNAILLWNGKLCCCQHDALTRHRRET